MLDATLGEREDFKLDIGIEGVPHFVALRFKVETVMFVAWREDRHLLDDFKVESPVDEGVHFLRVIRHETDFL